jgi:ethanolamine ammonia-lyase small subunit
MADELIQSEVRNPPAAGGSASLIPSSLEEARLRTPARILTGRAGASYRTATWIRLREDHAAARDAVFAPSNLAEDLGQAFVQQWKLFEVTTLAETKNEYLLRPDLGRSLSATAKAEITSLCPRGVDFQVVISDGLSATAVRAQVPTLLPLLSSQAQQRAWRMGQPFLIRHGRVGVLNDIGDVLEPAVVVLLIGERPGLATAESLSAYMAYRPRAGHDDSQRNLISNIHARGVGACQAAERIGRLAEQMIALGMSGVRVKEQSLVYVTQTSNSPPE